MIQSIAAFARTFLFAFLIVVAGGGAALAEKPPIFAADGLAIRGYDPVAYFTEGKPVAGDPRFTHEWRGAKWRFATAANRDAFKADPAKYAPQYGGYCAFGTAQGYAVPTDPHAWRIVDGKLYLNYNIQVRERWQSDIPGFITRADENWPAVLKK